MKPNLLDLHFERYEWHFLSVADIMLCVTVFLPLGTADAIKLIMSQCRILGHWISLQAISDTFYSRVDL